MPVHGCDAASPLSPSNNISHLFNKVARVYKKKKKRDNSRFCANGGGSPSLGRTTLQEETSSEGPFTRSNGSSSSRSSEQTNYDPASRDSSSEVGPSVPSPREPSKKDSIIQSVFSLLPSLSNAYIEVQASFQSSNIDANRLLLTDRDVVANLRKLSELKQAYACVVKEERNSARYSYVSDNMPSLEELLQGEEEEAMEKAQKDLIMKSYEGIIENFHMEVQMKNVEIEKLKDMLAKTTLKKENLEKKVKKMLDLVSKEAISCMPSLDSQLSQPSLIGNHNHEGIIEKFHLELQSKNAEIEKLKDILAKTTLKNEKLEKEVKHLLNVAASKEAMSCMPSQDSQFRQLSLMVNHNSEEGISENSHLQLQVKNAEREKPKNVITETALKKEKLERKVNEMLDFTSKEAVSCMPSLDSQLSQLCQLSHLSLMLNNNDNNEGMSENSHLELQAKQVEREKPKDMLAESILKKEKLEKKVNEMLDFSSKEGMSWMPGLDSQLSQLSQLSLLSLESQLGQLSQLEKPEDTFAEATLRKAKLEKEVNNILDSSSKEAVSCMPSLDSQLSQLSQLSLLSLESQLGQLSQFEKPEDTLAEATLMKVKLEKEVNNMLDCSSKEAMSCMPSLDSQLNQLSQLSLLSLESQLGELSQLSPKANNSSNEASLSPSQLFEGAAQSAFEEVRSFSKLLLSLMKLSNWDLDSACTSIVPGVDFSLESHRKYAWESYVCHHMMEGFEDPNFNLSSQELANKPNIGLDLGSYFSQYQAMKCVDPWELINKDPSGLFSRFCKKKYLHLVYEKMEASFFGGLEHRLKVGTGKHPDTNFYRRFLKLAKSLWILHLLGSSFEHHAIVFEATRGNAFSPRFMTSVAQPSHNINPPPDAKVGFTVMPGFELHEIIVKCQVYVVKGS